MVKGLYIGASSMITNINKMDVIGNNLANVNTTGFKKDSVEVESFNARLLTRINGSMYPIESGSGKVKQTQSGDEITATTENGYFRVQTENGINYSKSLIFFKDADGYLRTIKKNIGGTVNFLKGDLVLGKNGPINIGDGDFTLDENGKIMVDGTVKDQLLIGINANDVGTISAGIKGYYVMTNFEQGQLEATNSPFDLAIRGNGFFTVSTSKGDYYTRDGVFTINNANELVDLNGAKLIGLDGPITVNSENFAVNEFGEVIQDGEITDKIKMTAFSNVGDIYKVGTGYYLEQPTMTGERIDFDGEIVQGYREQSNSDAVTEMISLIEMNRNYETSQKVITTIDDMIGKCVTELGRV
ncbi:flagellar hook-basal body protein [Fusibacter bizertensis]